MSRHNPRQQGHKCNFSRRLGTERWKRQNGKLVVVRILGCQPPCQKVKKSPSPPREWVKLDT